MKSQLKRTARTLSCLLATAVLFPTACSRKADPTLLARVGSSEIHIEQFRQQMDRRGGARPETLDKQALLQEMIDQEALYLRALKSGLDKDPELQRTWRRLLIGKFKERELAPRLAKAEVTKSELEAAYANERQRYTRPAAVRVAVLYLKVEPEMTPERVSELRNRMSEARQKALAAGGSGSPGFGTLAISCSEDQATRYTGGVVGWIEKNRGHAWLGPPAIEAAFALANPGELSEVVTDSAGVYLIKLLDRREASVIPLTEVEASLRQRLLLESRRQIEQGFTLECRQSVPVETHPERLARIATPASPAVVNQRPPAFP